MHWQVIYQAHLPLSLLFIDFYSLGPLTSELLNGDVFGKTNSYLVIYYLGLCAEGQITYALYSPKNARASWPTF